MLIEDPTLLKTVIGSGFAAMGSLTKIIMDTLNGDAHTLVTMLLIIAAGVLASVPFSIVVDGEIRYVYGGCWVVGYATRSFLTALQERYIPRG